MMSVRLCLTPELANELSLYFNRISGEFSPIQDIEIPKTHNRAFPVLQPYQVSGRLRAYKKT